jgi:hypothetical protein
MRRYDGEGCDPVAEGPYEIIPVAGKTGGDVDPIKLKMI